MPAIDRIARRIDLSGEVNAVDVAVLEKLRGILYLNDFFLHLSLSHNFLNDDCVSTLCAILKDKTYFETLELQDCGLRDKDFVHYLVPALLARKRIRRLDVSMNRELTDASAGSIARLIEHGDLVELHLHGLPLTRVGGQKIVEALEENTTLELCSLPFTLGFAQLEKATVLVSRNARYKTMMRAEAERRELLLPPQPQLSETVPPAEGTSPDPPASAGDQRAVLPTESKALQQNRSIAKYVHDHWRRPAVQLSTPRGTTTDRKADATRHGTPSTLPPLPKLSPASLEAEVPAASSPTAADRFGDTQLTAASPSARTPTMQATFTGTLTASVNNATLPWTQQTVAFSTSSLKGPISTAEAAGSRLLAAPVAYGGSEKARTALAVDPPRTLPGVSSPLPTAVTTSTAAIGSLERTTLQDWVDPAVQHSLAYLYVLDDRSRLLEQHKTAVQQRRREQRGLAGRPSKKSARRLPPPSLAGIASLGPKP